MWVGIIHVVTKLANMYAVRYIKQGFCKLIKVVTLGSCFGVGLFMLLYKWNY